MSSSLRLGNMVGGLGWLRRRVCTCRLGSPPPASYPLEDGFFSLSRFCIADHGPPKMPGAVQTCGIASSRRALSPYPIFIAPGFILFSEVGRIRSAGFSWINLRVSFTKSPPWRNPVAIGISSPSGRGDTAPDNPLDNPLDIHYTPISFSLLLV